jgi:arylsulfatase A-like enzyme
MLVSIDSLRRDYCSLGPSTEDTTPFLASLGETATVFDEAISPSIWTLPVHCSVFTGLYPFEHQLVEGGMKLGDHPTLAELLGQESYETRSFGRAGWLETGDILRGFTHEQTDRGLPSEGFSGGGSAPSRVLLRRTLMRMGSDVKSGAVGTVPGWIRTLLRVANVKAGREVFRHRPMGDLTVADAVDAIEDTQEPFCYFVHLNDVHSPYRPASPYHKQYGNNSLRALRRNLSYQRELVDNRGNIFAGEYEFNEEQLSVMRDLYRGCIRQTDEQVRRLVEALRSNDLFDETVAVVFSDHGEMLGDENHWGHSFSLSDSLIRVPLLVRDPTGKLDPGRPEGPVQLNDLYPTLASIAGVDTPDTLSVDLTSSERDEAFAHYYGPEHIIERVLEETDISRSQLPPRRQLALWRSPEQKVVWNLEEETFTGPADDDEELRQRLRRHLSELAIVEPTRDLPMSETVRQNLQEMGYL